MLLIQVTPYFPSEIFLSFWCHTRCHRLISRYIGVRPVGVEVGNPLLFSKTATVTSSFVTFFLLSSLRGDVANYAEVLVGLMPNPTPRNELKSL